jgi:ketosteroid isomerase-like protein
METTIVSDFVDAINNANVDKMVELMATDHLFIDSQDHKMEGKDNLRDAWTGYFALFPDYKIEINEILANESVICMFGYASGTYKNLIEEDNRNHWRIPAAWKAIVIDNHIMSWQVYTDNIIVMDIIKRNN